MNIKKKVKDKDSAVVIATESKKVKRGGSVTGNAITEEDEEDEETKDEESEDDELNLDDDEVPEDDESEEVPEEDEETEDDESEEDDKKVIKMKIKTAAIKESTDHIIGIISTGKLHLLEDDIMGVVSSKIREKIEERKSQIKAKIAFGEG
jgi:hypothetical protein